MKKVFSLLMALVLLISVTSVFADLDISNAKKTIKVGINAEYKPFEYYENGVLTGFDIDLMNLIGERTGYEIEYFDMSFEQLIPSVQSEKIDCAISTFTVTEDRDLFIDFSREYLMTNIITFNNRQKSVKRGEYYAIVFREGLSGAPYSDLDNPTDDEKLYIAVDKAIRDLSQDRTVLNLIEKYDLNKPIDESLEENIEYQDIRGHGSPAAQISATSVPSSQWAVDSIEKAGTVGIINRGGNYNFPGAITRGEFCDIIFNYITKVKEKMTQENNIAFGGISVTKIQALNKMGIISGKEDNDLAPDDLLTREEAAAILLRLINKLHPEAFATEMFFEFDDLSEISDWAMNSIQTLCNMRIMNGTGDGNFSPKATFSTEQAIATVMRIYDSFNIKNENNDYSFSDKLNAQMPQDKNYMFSPLSIKMALTLAANGASGDTKDEILTALGISDLDDFNAISKDIIERYSKTDMIKLNIANSIWMNKDKTTQNFSESFKRIATEYFNADVKTINNENAVKEINSWVNDKTNGKIPQIIDSSDDFWSMLINAIYFKGMWEDEFYEYLTAPDEFTNADGTKSQPEFMTKTDWSAYAETESAKIIELPYKNRIARLAENGQDVIHERYDDIRASMYLVMADSNVDIETELNRAINDNQFASSYVRLSMPKFKIEFSTGLNDILMNLGIKSAFDSQKADFYNMYDTGNMWVTNTIHKTYINVDEKGTEAAAVTAIANAGSSLPPEPIELKFNRPFYFVIRDNTSGETLFMGRYAYGE